MEKINKLAKEIVENLVACDSAEPEAVDQYEEWTQKRLEKAFRALEHDLEKECDILIDTAESMRQWKQRAEAAEAKLAGLEKQEPAFLLNVDSRDSEQYQFDIRTKLSDGVHELFTRPAPAADLAELVPDKWYFQLTFDIPNLDNMTPYQAHGAAWEQCRAAILRNIEEAR